MHCFVGCDFLSLQFQTILNQESKDAEKLKALKSVISEMDQPQFLSKIQMVVT